MVSDESDPAFLDAKIDVQSNDERWLINRLKAMESLEVSEVRGVGSPFVQNRLLYSCSQKVVMISFDYM